MFAILIEIWLMAVVMLLVTAGLAMIVYGVYCLFKEGM